MDLRRETFMGFCKLEQQKGFLAAPTSLATPRGQEMARILMFRTIEEYTEALESVERAHVLEELIDSLNYLWSINVLDPQFSYVPFIEDWDFHYNLQNVPTEKNLGRLARVLSQATDKFRNRAWMNNAQDVYFNGQNELASAIELSTTLICENFQSWKEFWSYYVAKNNVLQFRLRTNY